MEYLHVSYTKGPSGRDHIVTLQDRVVDYKGRKILVQINEVDTQFGSRVRVRYVNVVELLEKLYASSIEHSAGLTRARKIEAPEDRVELSDMIEKLGVQEPINF